MEDSMFIEKRCDLIARAYSKGGVWDFWSFEKYTGQELKYGDFIIRAEQLAETENIKRILKDEKKRLTCDNFRRATCAMKESGSIKQFRQGLRIAQQHRTIIGY